MYFMFFMYSWTLSTAVIVYVPFFFWNEIKAYQFLGIMNPSNRPGVCHYWCGEYLIFSIVLPSGYFLYLPEYDGHMFKEGKWYLIDAVPPPPPLQSFPLTPVVTPPGFLSTPPVVFCFFLLSFIFVLPPPPPPHIDSYHVTYV